VTSFILAPSSPPPPYARTGQITEVTDLSALTIGAELNGPSIDDPSGEFVGYIRDVRIYDRALSDAEVKTLAEEARRQVTK
jgi:hypothetical protein